MPIEQLLPPWTGFITQSFLFTGGSSVPGYSTSPVLPLGRCRNNNDCNSTGLFCDTSVRTAFCTCSAGRDACEQVGMCKPTPCQVCQDCLQWVLAHFLTSNLYQPENVLASNFNKTCISRWTNTTLCSAVSWQILTSTPNGNMGRRAARLCNGLQACGSSTAACNLTIVAPNQLVLSGSLDLCTVEGITNGSLPSGVSAPSGMLMQSGSCQITAGNFAE
jgi:hypothetical protein